MLSIHLIVNNYQFDEWRMSRLPSVELSSGVTIVAEYRRHTFGTANIADSGGISSYII